MVLSRNYSEQKKNECQNLHGISRGRTENRLDSNKYINLKFSNKNLMRKSETSEPTPKTFLFASKKRIKIKMHFCQAIKESIINRNQHTQAASLVFSSASHSSDFGLISPTIKEEGTNEASSNIEVVSAENAERRKKSRGKNYTREENLFECNRRYKCMTFQISIKLTLRI